MEIGIYTFAEMSPDAGDRGRAAAQRLRDLLEEIELADQVGLDVFGVGEHHRPDSVVSSPAVVLAAAAARTTREVTLDATYEGAGRDPWGGDRVSFSATTKIDRREFGLTWNAALETGGVLVSNDIKIHIEAQAVRA